MLVQIYGLTDAADTSAVDRLGPDLIGIVVDEGIPTWDSVEEFVAVEMRSAVERSRVVALSLSTDPDRIRRTVELMRPDVVHLARAHLMDPAILANLRRSLEPELMLTVPVDGRGSLAVAERLAPLADYLLLDTSHPESGVVGATGLVHDWELSAQIVTAVDRPVLLAGGLGPENVREAIAQVRPAGVDSETRTSSSADRRRKDLGKVRAFIQIARAGG